MHLDRRHTQVFLLLGLVMVLWAGNSIVARAVRFEVPPFTLAFLRWTGATLAVLPFAIRPFKRDCAAIRRGWRPLLFLGLTGIGAFNALLYSGLHYTTATNALLLQAAVPAAMVLLDRVFFGVRAGGWQIVGITASIIGVAAIVFEGDPGAALRLHFGPGDALILASVVAWALYTVFLRTKPAISPTSFIAVTFSIGVLAMGPLAAMEQQAGETIAWSWPVAAAVLYVALLPSLFSYFLYNHATHVVGPANAGQAITLMPLFGALIAAALLGERLQAFHFAGMAFILAGIALSVLASRAKVPAGAGQVARLEDRA